MTKFTKLLIGSVAGAIAFAAPARAQVWRVGNDSYHVYFNDLDLTKAAGRSEALRRIDRASASLCDAQLRSRECAERTSAETAAKIGSRWIKLALAERDAVRLAAR